MFTLCLSNFDRRLEDLLRCGSSLSESNRLGGSGITSLWVPVTAMGPFFDTIAITVFGLQWQSPFYVVKRHDRRHQRAQCQKFLQELVSGCIDVGNVRYASSQGLTNDIFTL